MKGQFPAANRKLKSFKVLSCDHERNKDPLFEVCSVKTTPPVKILLDWCKRLVAFLLSFVLNKVRKPVLSEKGRNFLLDEKNSILKSVASILKFYFQL